MSDKSRVAWTEGLFLQPQHFQQHERFVERYVELRAAPLRSHAWGFTELELETDLLAVGKLALRRAAGVFPDGTPFCMPDDEPLPPAWEPAESVRDEIVHLALPRRRSGALELSRPERADSTARFQARVNEARDSSAPGTEQIALEVASLQSRLLPASEPREDYACIPVARLIERRADGQLVLDAQFIPTVLRASAAARLRAFLQELKGLLHQRGEALGGRVTASARGGSEIADYLMLQAINRYEPMVNHLAASEQIHPEDLFCLLAALSGELATYTLPGKRPAALPAYRHAELTSTFEPAFAAARNVLSAVLEQTAIPIPLEQKRYGISVAVVGDKSLFDSAMFVLAVKADLPTAELARHFPSQTKIGPVERIRDLVNLQLPGVALRTLPTPPRQIPFHAGTVYFELEQGSEVWQQLKSAGGTALHVAGDLPGLTMELWAIRG